MRDPQTDPRRATGPLDHLLTGLVQDIKRSRQVLRDLLDSRRPGNVTQVLEAREESRIALERFVATLVEHQLPVPRQIHDELALARRLCGHLHAPYRYVPPPTE